MIMENTFIIYIKTHCPSFHTTIELNGHTIFQESVLKRLQIIHFLLTFLAHEISICKRQWKLCVQDSRAYAILRHQIKGKTMLPVTVLVPFFGR